MNGFIYKGVFEGWYDQVQEAFVPKNKVREGMALEWRSEDNYLFRLSSQKDRVIRWIKEDNERIVPKFHRDEVLRMIEANGVMDHDLSISRLMKNMNWAIPVKNDPEYGIYVWFDALTNYLTACGFPDGHTNASGNITWPIDLHVIGKDILKFHTIYWPAFLAAAGIELPRKILVHSHWTRDGIKMSKSLGNVIHPQALFQTLGGVDQARYVVLRSGKIDRDSDFSMHAAIRIANDELADTFGNLVSRCLTLLPSHNRTYPSLWRDQMGDQETLLEKQLNELNLAFMENFEKFKLPYAVDAILKALSSANAYFTENQPWHLVKSAKTSQEKEKLENVLYLSIESCRIAAILLQPLMPSKMSSLLDHLGVPMNERSIDFAQVGKCSSRFISSEKMILFPRIK
jgi:methionyl-tRNA synthetase